MKYYSTVQEVRNYTGTKYDDLALNSDTDLNTLIENYLKQIKSLIDQNRGRDLEKDLNFGDKNIIVPAEKQWSGEGEQIYDKDLFPKGDYLCVNYITLSEDDEIKSIIDEDLSKAKVIGLIINPNDNLSSGDLQIKLYTDSSGTTEKKSINLRAVDGWEWVRCVHYLNDLTLASIKCIGIKATTDITLYLAEVYVLELPQGIHNIAMRACANMVKLAYANRESPVITIDDMNAQLIKDEILTPELRKELSIYKKKANFGIGIVEGKIYVEDDND